MQFQTADISIVRSIRQVSLVRDWQRSRGPKALPNLADFTPNERAGDAADILIAEVTRQDSKFSYVCRSAGERVAQIFGLDMVSRRLEDCLDAAMAKAARPIWDACVARKLPVYSILPLTDRGGCPVTIEQLFLPYSRGSGETDSMLAVFRGYLAPGPGPRCTGGSGSIRRWLPLRTGSRNRPSRKSSGSIISAWRRRRHRIIQVLCERLCRNNILFRM